MPPGRNPACASTDPNQPHRRTHTIVQVNGARVIRRKGLPGCGGRWVWEGFGRRIPSVPNPMRWPRHDMRRALLLPATIPLTPSRPSPGPIILIYLHTHTILIFTTTGAPAGKHQQAAALRADRRNGARSADSGGHHLDHHLRGRDYPHQRGQDRPLHEQGQRWVRIVGGLMLAAVVAAAWWA